jgi:cytochrome b6-f complex iron-sulfur subunit
MIEAKATSPTDAINRREFLYYLLGASIAIFAAETCGASVIWLRAGSAKPRSGEQDGLFTFLPAQLPQSTPDSIPIVGADRRFWLSNSDKGLMALNPACTARGCLYKWQPNGGPGHEYPHFVCPCCGSQFTKWGVYVAGVAPRNLDQFAIEVTTANGIQHTPADGGPVDIQGATQIVVDIQNKILGKSRSDATHSPPVLMNP